MNENRGIELAENLGIFNKPSIEDLKKIEEKRQAERLVAHQERERVKLAMNLNMCPQCGDPLKEELIEKLSKPEKKFFGLITKTERKWKFRKVCSTSSDHCVYTRTKNYAIYATAETVASEFIGSLY